MSFRNNPPIQSSSSVYIGVSCENTGNPKNISPTAKEMRKLMTFKAFEYLIISIPEFGFTYEVNRYVMTVL